MTKILLTVFFLVWPFGQLAILPPILGERWFALDLLSLLLWISLLISGNKKKILSDQLFQPLALFIGALTLSNLFNLTFSPYLIRFISLTSVYFALRQTKIPKQLPVASLLIFLSFGLLQYFFLPDTRFLQYFDFDDHYYRLIGSFLDPNFTGLAIAQIALICFFCLPKRFRVLSVVPLVALALTFSRASYIAFTTGVITLASRNKRLLLVLAVLVFAILLVPKPFGEGVNLMRTFSIYSRLETQKKALELFVQKPVFGWGFNNLKQGVDNSFLFVAATTGILGIITFLNFLKKLFQFANKSLLLTAILITSLTHSLFNNSFFYLWQTSLLWSALALLSKEKS